MGHVTAATAWRVGFDEAAAGSGIGRVSSCPMTVGWLGRDGARRSCCMNSVGVWEGASSCPMTGGMGLEAATAWAVGEDRGKLLHEQLGVGGKEGVSSCAISGGTGLEAAAP